MKNCREEFLFHTGGLQVKAAWISRLQRDDEGGFEEVARLAPGYTEADLESFLSAIDFDYDDGYGTQEVDGVIWYKDGTWSTRGEYDGSEWWTFYKVPDIADFLD